MLSVSGVPLAGSRYVRLIYMDEAGISCREDEPWTVEAGIIASPDMHLSRVQKRFDEIRAEFLPRLSVNEPFHTKDIWHGTKAFHRDDYNLDTRLHVLKQLAEIPAEIGLPIVAGYYERSKMHNLEAPAEMNEWMEKHTPLLLAFSSCLFSAEAWLRWQAPDEVSMVIHENTDFGRGLGNALKMFQSKEIAHASGAPKSLFPFVRISDELMFASKGGSCILQLADLCAFFIKRQLSQKDSKGIFSILEPQIIPHWKKGNSLFLA